MANQHSSAEVRDRELQCLELRRNGASYDQIADRLGISKSTAHDAVQRALARDTQEVAGDVRKLELARLDQFQLAALAVLRRDHVIVSGGKVVLGEDGKPIRDDGPSLSAIKTLLDIQLRRARLLGLDAPTKHEHKVLTIDEVDAAIIEAEAELATLDATSPPPSPLS